jgi:redox-sensitive bicupin YhaK (pirin superfamily)
MKKRGVIQYWQAVTARDGAGVTLKRALGARPDLRLDPFLMLDAFSSDNPDDYIAGFPAHPHRGFETVTYIVDGHMKHKDHLGNEGDLKAGGVQWMTAGRGIIHEEMPQQKDGLLRGFQLWLNLPAKDKMQAANYEDVPAESMPWHKLAGGGEIKLIAGGVDGNNILPDATRVTAPIIADVRLVAEEILALPEGHQALVYVFEGEVEIGGQVLRETDAAILGHGDELVVMTDKPARLLLVAGAPLNEPVVQYGPFVMNTKEEIEQAVADYRNGTLTV